MSAPKSEENIQSGRVEWHDTIQKAILERVLAEEMEYKKKFAKVKLPPIRKP
jgi:hypothetical protein